VNETLDTALKSSEPKLREFRRDFHRHAESGWCEYRTASIVAKRLDALGYALKIGREAIDEGSRMGLPDEAIMEARFRRALDEGAVPEYAERMKGGFTGVVGEIANGDRPVIAFRFDMDAVEMEEKSGDAHFPNREGFASIHKDAMHSCGHDGHTAMGLCLAEVLVGMRAKLRGKVRLIFQPAEEGVRGARAMVAAGVVDDVDFLYGLHIGTSAKETGEFYCGTGGFLATSKFDAYFSGKSTHAVIAPNEGRNALLAAATAVLNLNAIPRHGRGATRINVGRMTAGSGRNVIPAEAYLAVETRGEDSELDEYVKNYAVGIIRSSAEMHGCGSRIVEMGAAESADSDEELVMRAYEIAKRYSVFPTIESGKAKLGGSEDFSTMMNRVKERGGKACYFLLGSRLAGSHHSVDFDFDESVLANGVKMLALLALEP